MLNLLGRLFVPACALLLAGCTASSFMEMGVSDYRKMFSTTGDEQILVNILRARDSAPLHFTELQTLGASTQLSSSLQVTDPIGQPNGSTARASLQGTFGAQTTPTFSLSSLELQQFTQGLMNPVSPSVIQQLLEEGVDRRLIFLLFFSGITDGNDFYLNNIRCDKTELTPQSPPDWCYGHFFNYLRKVNTITEKRIAARTYLELKPIGTSVPWPASTGVKDIAGIDPTKYSVEPDPNDPTKAIVYSISDPRLALCWVIGQEPRTRLVPVLPGGDRGICTLDRVYARSRNTSKGLIIRSTYQIIEYLGQVLNYQERHAYENRCVKLGFEGREHLTCDEGEIFFQVNPARGSPLVTTSYGGSPYTIGLACEPQYCDHSAEVMKIVNLLININKSAANIPQVPTVRIIQ